MERDLTASEAAAIKALQRLAKKWPKTLTLVSMNGSLSVVDSATKMDGDSVNPDSIIEDIDGIPNDGGDW